jgi:hypothetical protein
VYQVCPACREHPVGIGKPVCLQCWRFVPSYIQKAVHVARRKCLADPDDVACRLALDTTIREAIKAAREHAAAS